MSDEPQQENAEPDQLLKKAAKSVGATLGAVAATAEKVVNIARRATQREPKPAPSNIKKKDNLDLHERRRANKKRKRMAHQRTLRRSNTPG